MKKTPNSSLGDSVMRGRRKFLLAGAGVAAASIKLPLKECSSA
jgi:hypothetical protein